jgi:hypothetical protein
METLYPLCQIEIQNLPQVLMEFIRGNRYKITFNISFHSQTNGQMVQMIQTLEDMLRLCVLDFKRNWIKYLLLIEFSYNNSYYASLVRFNPI